MKARKIGLTKKLEEGTEYTNSLQIMIEKEKANLVKIYVNQQKEKDKITEIEAKLHILHLSQTVYLVNNESVKGRTRNVKEIELQLEGEVKTMKDIFKVQNKTLSRLTGDVESKKSENLHLRVSFEKNKFEKERSFLERKNDLGMLIKETQASRALKKETEGKYIKLILGLNLISNYFLKNNEDFVENSDDFLLFKAKFYQITEGVNQENLKRKLTNVSGLSQSPEKQTKISLEYIKEKYENMNISELDIRNLVSQLQHKKSFYQQYINNFNLKQVKLEIQKDKNINRVKRILNFGINLQKLGLDKKIINKFSKELEGGNIQINEINFEFDDNSDYKFFEKVSGFFDDMKSLILSILLIYQEHIEDLIGKPKFLLLKSEVDEMVKKDKTLKDTQEQNLQFMKKILQEYDEIRLKREENKNQEGFPEEFFPILCEKIKLQRRIYSYLELSNSVNTIITLINEISAIQTQPKLVRNRSKNLSVDEKMQLTSSNLSENKSRKSVLKGAFEIITSISNNNRYQKEDSSDSLEEFYLKEKEVPVKNSVFNLRTRNMIKTNGFMQKLNKNTEVKSYSKLINEKLGVIKKITTINKKEIFVLNKKKKEVQKMSNDLILFNNPNINLNSLNGNTYNSFVKYIIDKQLKSQNQSRSSDEKSRVRFTAQHSRVVSSFKYRKIDV